MTALKAYFLRLPGVERVLLSIYVIIAFYIVSNAPFLSFLYSPGFTQFTYFSLPFPFYPMISLAALACICVVLAGKVPHLRVLIFVAHYLLLVGSPFAVWGWFYFSVCLHLHFLIIHYLKPSVSEKEWLTSRHLDFMFSILYLSVILYRIGSEGWFNGDALYYSLSSSVHSRWGFLVLDPNSILLKTFSFAGLGLEILFIGIFFYPEKIRRYVYFLVIVFHLSLELMLTEEFWNYTVIMLVLCRLSMTPAERPSGKVFSSWIAVAVFQLLIAIPTKFYPDALRPFRQAIVGSITLETVFLRRMNMYEDLPQEKYLCPVYMTKSANGFSIEMEYLKDCRNPSFRWRLHPVMALVRMGDPTAYLSKVCEYSPSKQQAVFYYTKSLKTGAEEELMTSSCWDCLKKQPCDEQEIGLFRQHISQN